MLFSMTTNWDDLLKAEDKDFSLLSGALLIAKDEYPDLQIGSFFAKLQALFSPYLEGLPTEFNTPSLKLQSLIDYFFLELKFQGNQHDYYDLRNSFMNEVLERRLGIPISLSILFLEMGRLIGLPLQGISFPGHFLIKCQLTQGMILIDVFEQGRRLGIKDLQNRLRSLSNGALLPPEMIMSMLTPASNREIIARMLRNIKTTYREQKQWDKALTASCRIIDLNPGWAEEYRHRAELYEALECFQLALDDYLHYLSIDANAEDVYLVRLKISDLRSRIAKLN